MPKKLVAVTVYIQVDAETDAAAKRKARKAVKNVQGVRRLLMGNVITRALRGAT